MSDLTPAEERTLAWQTLPCRTTTCLQPAGRRCITSSGERTSPHAPRIYDIRAYLLGQATAQAENAALTEQLANVKASYEQVTAALTTSDDKLDMAMQRLANLQLDLADAQQALADYIASHPDVPKPATRFGFWPGQDTNGGTESWATSYARVSGYLGKPQVLRDFPSAGIPTTFKGSRVDNGTPAVVQSFSKVALADWLSGKAGDQLAAYLATIPAGVDFYWCPHHEPYPEWTTAQIAAVWTKVLTQVPTAPNLHPTAIPMGYDWASKRWSDDSLVDGIEVLAPDIYLTSSTLAAAFEPPHATAVKHGLRFGVSETAKRAGFKLPGLTEEQTTDALVTYLHDVVAGEWDAAYITWFESNKSDGDWRMRPFSAAVSDWANR